MKETINKGFKMVQAALKKCLASQRVLDPLAHLSPFQNSSIHFSSHMKSKLTNVTKILGKKEKKNQNLFCKVNFGTPTT